jgi:ankyrin repeat protein
MPESARGKNAEGLLPIHLAAKEGNVAVAKLLVQCYDNIDVRCYKGMSPLHYCAVYGKTAMARFLLECGANKQCLNIEGP